MIEPVGKVKSNFTGKKVTVFGVRNGWKKNVC
jgi:hypothetical protein